MKNSVLESFAFAALAAALLSGCGAEPWFSNTRVTGATNHPAPTYGERLLPDQPFNPDEPHMQASADIRLKSKAAPYSGRLEVKYRIVTLDRRLIACGLWIATGGPDIVAAARYFVSTATLEIEDIPVANLHAFKGYRQDVLPPEGLTAGCVEADNPVPAPWSPAYSQVKFPPDSSVTVSTPIPIPIRVRY